jgi:hypothetical protein
MISRRAQKIVFGLIAAMVVITLVLSLLPSAAR